MSESKFIVGAEVVEKSSGGFGAAYYGPTRKVSKVYKNGNFTIGDDRQQYRPSSDGVTAMATGDDVHRWTRSIVYLVTDELRAEIATSRKEQAAIKAIDSEIERLKALALSRDHDAIVAEASRIRSRAAQTAINSQA